MQLSPESMTLLAVMVALGVFEYAIARLRPDLLAKASILRVGPGRTVQVHRSHLSPTAIERPSPAYRDAAREHGPPPGLALFTEELRSNQSVLLPMPEQRSALLTVKNQIGSVEARGRVDVTAVDDRHVHVQGRLAPTFIVVSPVFMVAMYVWHGFPTVVLFGIGLTAFMTWRAVASFATLLGWAYDVTEARLTRPRRDWLPDPLTEADEPSRSTPRRRKRRPAD